MTNLNLFCSCDECFFSNQEEEVFDNLLDEVEELVKIRDSLNMQNLLEEGKPEPGENEFSFESRRLKLGMMSEREQKPRDWYSFAPPGKRERYCPPKQKEKLEKKKAFQFDRS